jgi:hypothetical protein
MEFIIHKSTLHHTLHQTLRALSRLDFLDLQNVRALFCDVYETMSKHYLQL